MSNDILNLRQFLGQLLISISASGDQVCYNLDLIKAANWGIKFISLPLLADLLVATCCALIVEYSSLTRFNSLTTVEWWTPIKLAILWTEYLSFLKISIWLRFSIANR